jgi:hypothetical protein
MLVVALQEPAPHTVPGGYLWQPPRPSQVPSLSHLALPRSLQALRGSGALAGVLLQRPGVCPSTHDRQGPWQAVSQQTPSTQKPFWHSVPVLQGCPVPFFPQLLVARSQTCPGAQSSFFWQVELHAPAAQAKGTQVRSPPGTQSPAPSQRLALCRTVPLQLAGWQTVLVGYRAHPPLALQVPVRPQLVAPSSGQRPRGSFSPSGAGRHIPTEPSWVQLRQGPAQTLSQQTPSTQKPLEHSLPAPHTAPASLVPQLPAMHWRPFTHWSSLVQRL